MFVLVFIYKNSHKLQENGKHGRYGYFIHLIKSIKI